MRLPERLGFRGKTLWDWLQLLIVPAILIAVTFAWSATQTRSDNRREDRRIAADQAAAEEARQDATLQGYLDQMGALMLDRNLLASKSGDAVRAVARTLTLTTLRRLDGERKGTVVRFLAESMLLDQPSASNPDPLVRMNDADLRGINLKGADLEGSHVGYADFTGANLEGAYLLNANLTGSVLRRARLKGAVLENADLLTTDFSGVDLTAVDSLAGADLRHSDFSRANLSGVNLQDAMLGGTDLRGANLKGTDIRGASLKDPDIQVVTRGLDLVRYLAGLAPLRQKEILDSQNGFLDSLTAQELAEFNLTAEKLAKIRREASGG